MMARLDDIDPYVEALERVDDEHLTSLSHTPATQALYEEVVSMNRDPETKREGRQHARSNGTASDGGRSRRRRLVWQGAAVVGAAVVVLAVLSIVNVFGANGPSIVEKAVAALDPGENAIVHIKVTGHESGKDGYSSEWIEESWWLTAAPYTSRLIQASDGSPVTESVQDNTGFSQVYDAATNTIYQPPGRGGFRFESDQSDRYREMILEMLDSGEAAVEGPEIVDGRECLRIAATKDYGTALDGTKYGTWYLVDKDTMNPVEWRITRDGGKVVIFHFDVYEQLPASEENLALLDLAAQHPGAALNTSLEDYQDALGIPHAGPGSDTDAAEHDAAVKKRQEAK